MKLDFFPLNFFSALFFQIGKCLSYLNCISVNLKKNQRNFFERAGGHYHRLRRRLFRLGVSQLGPADGFRTQSPLSLLLSLHYPLALTLPLSPSTLPSLALLGPSLLGAPGFGTERERLVVQVERLKCTRLRRRTCKTSRSSKKASHPALAQNVQD